MIQASVGFLAQKQIVWTSDPFLGLVNGELVIPGNLLRAEVFDPIVDQVPPSTILTSILCIIDADFLLPYRL